MKAARITSLLILSMLHASYGQLTIFSATENFARFIGKRISNQTSLTYVTIHADLHPFCAYLCLMQGSSCFAAQYVQGSFVCSLQLDCGVVLLESDAGASGTTSVYIPSKSFAGSSL